MTQHEVHDAVLGFLRSNIVFDESRVIPDDESFLTAGILDSTGILELIGFLEERFGVHFRDDELIAGNFDSLSQVSRFVAAKLSSSPKP
jgi:acyl carrier protein